MLEQEKKILEIAPNDSTIIEMVERIPRRISSFVKEISLDHSFGNPRFLRNRMNPRRFYLVYTESEVKLFDINEKLVVHETDVTELIDINNDEITFELDDSIFELHKIVRRISQ